MKPWYKRKTTWVGISAVLGAVGGVVTGEMAIMDAIQVGLTGLIGIFLREAVNNR